MAQRSKWQDFWMINLGVLLTAVGIYFFKFPNNFSMGGVSGISVILGAVAPKLSPGTFQFIINMALMVVGFLIFGRGFGIKTAYASTMLSVEVSALEFLFPMSHPLTDQPILELVFAIMLPGFGAAIIFNADASSGGTDVIAMILKKYTNLNIGRALLISDFIITLGALIVFGPMTGLCSMLGLAAKALVVDQVIESINLCKYFTIITTKPNEINEFIVKDLHHSATMMSGSGAYTHENKTVIVTVVRRGQAILLQKFVRSVDEKAFMVITNTSEIIGKGFRGNT